MNSNRQTVKEGFREFAKEWQLRVCAMTNQLFGGEPMGFLGSDI
jgi:hypothetical protein